MLRFLEGKTAKIAIGASMVAAALATFVATGFGSAATHSRSTHAAAAAHFRDIRVSAAITAPGIKFVYVRAGATVPPGQFFGGALRCPKRFPHPISGLFDSNSDHTYLATSRPEPIGVSPKNARKWSIGVTNTDTTQPANVLAGVVCAQ